MRQLEQSIDVNNAALVATNDEVVQTSLSCHKNRDVNDQANEDVNDDDQCKPVISWPAVQVACRTSFARQFL